MGGLRSNSRGARTPMVTASRLPLLRRCPGAAVLRHYRSTSDAAARGTRLHGELLPALIAGRLPDTPEGRALARVEQDWSGARAEVAYALRLGSSLGDMSARELPTAGHRDYSAAAVDEVPGTADVVTEQLVDEFKFGHSEQAAPRQNAQLWLPALARWAIDGSLVRLRLVHVRPPGSDGRCHVSAPWHDVTLADLVRWHSELVSAMARVSAARAALADGDTELVDHLVVGDHCGRCDVRLTCPAIGATLSLDDDASRLAAARARYERAKLELQRTEALVDGEDMLEADGLRYERVTRYRRKIDGERAIHTFPELQDFARTQVTAGALDEWARAQIELGASVGERIAAANRRLEEAGALSWTVATRLERA